MKNILCIIFTMFFIIGCNKVEKGFEIGQESNIKVQTNDILFYIKNNSLENSKAIFILENNSDKDLYFDEVYELETLKNGKWHKINLQISFTKPLYILKSKKTNEINLNWENSYGNLPKGKYRIIKKVSFIEENDNISFYISSEFTI